MNVEKMTPTLASRASALAQRYAQPRHVDDLARAIHFLAEGSRLEADLELEAKSAELTSLRAQVERLTRERDEARAEAARMRAALEDFRDWGLRCDLTPTMRHPASHAQYQDYLRSVDFSVRERARRAALTGPAAHNPAPPDSRGAYKAEIWHQIVAEREEQDRRFGGPSHDDTHSIVDWASYIRKHVDVAVESTPTDRRYSLIRVAALAVAAIESLDRKADAALTRHNPAPDVSGDATRGAAAAPKGGAAS